MKLLVIDGNSLINRAFYGVRPLTTKDGRFTNGIYGFLNMMMKLTSEFNPDSVAVAFDLKAPTFRHKIYSEYKAGRKGMPPELAEQMPVLKELLTLMGIKIIEKEGYEADDIIGTLASACEKSGHFCYIATGDRDSFQLVSDSVNVLLTATVMGRPEIVVYDNDKIAEKYNGLTPKNLIDVKALMGDSSDNIPGVAGVGEKTAVSLISTFKNLENLYKNIDSPEIKNAARNKLINDKEKAFLSRKLGTICCKVPIDTVIDNYVIQPHDESVLAAFLADLELFKIIERMGLQNVRSTATDSVTKSEIKFSKVEPNDILNADIINLLYYQNYIVISNENKYAICEYDDDFLFNLGGKKIRVYHSKEFYSHKSRFEYCI